MMVKMRQTFLSSIFPLILLFATWVANGLYLKFKSGYLPLVVVGLAIYCLVKSADNFTKTASKIGSLLRLSQLGTGILIIAIGTSAPEIFSGIAAAIKSEPKIVIGNVYGTIVANTLLGIGIAAIVSEKALKVHPRVISTQIPIFFGSICLSFGAFYNGIVDKIEAFFMLCVLISYLYDATISSKKDFKKEFGSKENEETLFKKEFGSKENEETLFKKEFGSKENEETLFGLLPMFVLMLLSLFLSGNFVVNGILNSAIELGISSEKLATSVLAVGTSIPEIATAISLIKDTDKDTAGVNGLFGEIIGSNIIDLLGIFGCCALISPLKMTGDLLFFLILSVLVMFLLINTIVRDKKVNKIEGIMMLAMFLQFTYVLIEI